MSPVPCIDANPEKPHCGRILDEIHTYIHHGRRKRGDEGDASTESKKPARDVTPQKNDISVSFFDPYENFPFSTIFKIKWPKSEERLNFGGS